MNKYTLMIVEDDGILAIHLQDLLTRQGYTVLKPVPTGEQAIRDVKKYKPDLVLMDIELGGEMNGIAAAEIIGNEYNIPVIFLTGFSQDPMLQQAKIAAPYGYLVKPVPERELAASIEMALYKHRVDHQIKVSEAKYRSLVEQATDGIILYEDSGKFLEVNQTYCQMLGYSRDDILTMRYQDVIDPHNLAADPVRFQEMKKGQIVRLERVLVRRDGSRLPVEISGRMLTDGFFQGIVRDITERVENEHQSAINEQRMHLLLEIAEYKAKDTQDLLDFALDRAISLTESKIGYIYFYNEESREFILNSWSKEVMRECTVTEPQTLYCLDKTGIWGEAVRQRKAIIINEYEAPDPLKKGYPEGHVHLKKFLTIPVFVNQKIVAVVGVANKQTNYDSTDELQLTLMMDFVWKMVEQSQADDKLRLQSEGMEKLLSISQDFLQISTADVDFEKIANNLLDLSGAKFAVLNLYEENGKDFRTAAAAGMNNLVKKVSEVLGFELTGKKWKQDPARAEKIKNSTIVRFATLQDLSCKVIPKTVMSVVQKTFHPGETIIVNINVGAKTIGDFTIIMPKGVRFEADDLVSVYARQVGLLLQRKQAEDEMRRSETFINSLFNAIPTPVYYKDTQGRFVRVNQEMSRIIGLPEEQILGKTVFFLNPQEKAQEYHKKDLELLSSGESQRYESVVFDTDGKPHAMIFHKAIHKSQNGKPEGYIGVLMDISERKQMEETLAFEKQRLANIIEATEVGTWEWNIQTWENVFNERYMGMLGYTLEELPATSKTWESLIHPEDRVISDRQLDMHLKGELDYYECEVRMRHKNGAWIWVQDRGKVTRWTDDGKPLMMYGTHQDITERKQAEEVRRQLEEKFTKAFNISPDAISITSMEDGCYIDVNEGFCRISGYSREEAVGKTSNELNLWPDPEDRKAIVRGLTQDGLVENLELSFRMKGGEIVTGLVSANIIEIEGKSCILAVIRDISERKRMEEALRYSEERFRLLFVEMAEGFALHEIVLDEDQKPVDYRFLEVNPAFEKQTGLKRDEIIGRSVKEVLPATEDYWIEAYGEVALKGTVRHFENYSSELNKWFNVAAFCPKYGQFATTVEDITERKLTDQALLDSKLKLEKAQRHAHIGSWTWDIKKNSLEWSEEMFRIFGLDKETFSGFLPDVMNNSIHPDDREAVEASNRSVAEQGKPIPLEYRIVLPDETVKTVWAEAGEIELDDKGSPSRLSGIVQDITDRKLADLALKESEEHFRQVTETINEVFWLCDAKTEDILYVSPNFETVFGRTCESFYENPRSFLDYVHPDDVEDIRMGQIALREQGINSDQEYRILRPDGEVRWLHGKVFPVKDSEGRTIRYTGTDEDITERRQLDEALREREHLLNQIFDILPVGLWIANAKGELVRSNPAGRKIWGAEPLVGQEEYGLFKARRLPSREVLAAEDWALVKTIKEGVTIQNEMLEIDAFDGEKRTILNSTAPVLNDDSKVQSAVIVNLDITDWMRTEEALKSTQLQFQSLIENAPDGIALLNEAMQFVYVSPAGRKIFGYDMEDSLAAAPDALTHPDDLPAVLSELQKIFIKPGLMTTLQYRFKHKDGSYRWLESIFTNLLHEPSVNGIIINFRDITDRRAAEQKVQEQINELRRWNAVTLGRENRVLELKQEVNRLCKQAGLPPVYGSDPIQEQNHD